MLIVDVSTADYSGVNTLTGENVGASLSYQTHTYTIYAAVRVANTRYRRITKSKCTASNTNGEKS
jgi:hypothetical protein